MVQKIGEYTILGKLAEGGMARVLKGVAADGTPVVLKIPLRKDGETIARFVDEARLGMRLSHPAIVRTRALEENDGLPVVVLDFIQGVTLEAMVSSAGPLDVGSTAYLASVVGDALATLHGATHDDGSPLHIVHRDITPRNILISDAGIPVLIDLGIARSDIDSHKTATGVLIGTLPYLAPELLEEEGEPSPASDMWSLGCVVFECAAGERLFQGPQPKVLGRLVKDHPVKKKHLAAVPEPVRSVIGQLLHRNPKDRIDDGRQIGRLLARVNQPRVAREELQRRCRALTGITAPAEAATFEAQPTLADAGAFGPAPVSIPGVGHIGTDGGFLDASSSPEFDVPATPSTKRMLPHVAAVKTEAYSREQSSAGSTPPGEPAGAPDISGAMLVAAFQEAAASVSSPAEMTTGEIKRRLGKADKPVATGSRQGGAFRPPRGHDKSLELETIEPIVKRDVMGVREAPHLGKRRKNKRSRFSLSNAVTWVLALSILGGLAYVGYRFSQGRSPDIISEVKKLDQERARLEAEARALGEAFLQHEKPPRAPSCWRSDHGWFFVYDDRGTQAVKQRILDVPRKYRPNARCVKQQ